MTQFYWIHLIIAADCDDNSLSEELSHWSTSDSYASDYSSSDWELGGDNKDAANNEKETVVF